ncbi:hypothetical protein ID866_2206 [Astraeus odoratus]|nr:hypothetical protein ID866_2206 [Astraeus odoratus]
MESPTAQLGLPDMPPMAEVRDRNSVLISTGGEARRRESFMSMVSNSSDPHTQYLVTPNEFNTAEPDATSPMSVRPFSPSETFSFPKPPVPASSVAVSSSQAASSTATLVQINSPPAVFSPELGSPCAQPIAVPPVFTSAGNPFEDPVEPSTFSGAETVRRPFLPTLEDELAVSPSDQVRILQVFDDGWAMVEKVGVVPGNPGQSMPQRRGLIPVDCFREAGQALPSFLAQKRLSSYQGQHGTLEPTVF